MYLLCIIKDALYALYFMDIYETSFAYKLIRLHEEVFVSED